MGGGEGKGEEVVKWGDMGRGGFSHRPGFRRMCSHDFHLSIGLPQSGQLRQHPIPKLRWTGCLKQRPEWLGRCPWEPMWPKLIVHVPYKRYSSIIELCWSCSHIMMPRGSDWRTVALRKVFHHWSEVRLIIGIRLQRWIERIYIICIQHTRSFSRYDSSCESWLIRKMTHPLEQKIRIQLRHGGR